MDILTHLDGKGVAELKGFRVQVLTEAPASPSSSRIYYDSILNKLRYYNGSVWKNCDYTDLTAGPNLEIVTNAMRLAASAAGAGLIGAGSEPLAVGAGTGIVVEADAVKVDTSIIATRGFAEELIQGLDVKQSVRVATTTALATNTQTANVLEASANGALEIDGKAVATGWRVLVKNEAEGKKNGIYTVTQAGGASEKYKLTRATDADSATEINGGTFTFVEEGTTNADTGWVVTTDGAITLNTTALTWAQFNGSGSYTAGGGIGKTGSEFFVEAGEGLTQTADGLKADTTVVALKSFVTGRSFAGNIGNGTLTEIEVSHGLASRDVTVQVYRNASPWDTVECDVQRLETGKVKLIFLTAPASEAFRVLVTL